MILTKRLLLRRARPDDVAAMHEVLSSTLAMRYWSGPPHTHIEQTRAWIDVMISAPPEHSEDFIIEIDGHAAGKVGAYRLPEFGYILHPDFWGQGYASEALSAFLSHLWRMRPDVLALTADVDPRNAASIRLLERHGFHETGRAERTFDTHIGWCNSIYFAISRAD